MLFFSRIHIPKFSLTEYEKQIERVILQKYPSPSDTDEYKYLLKLKKHALIMADSIHQLKSMFKADYGSPIDRLERDIQQAISLRSGAQHPSYAQSCLFLGITPITSELQDTLNNVERQIKGAKSSKAISAYCIMINSIICTYIAVEVLSLGAMFTGPVGMALIGLGVTMLAGAALTLMAYSIYVDGRYLFNKQLDDLQSGIDFLIAGPGSIESDITAGNDVDCPNGEMVFGLK